MRKSESNQRLSFNVSQLGSEGITLNGKFNSEIFGFSDDKRLKCSSPLIYNLAARIAGEGVLVSGSASTVCDCTCDRCLTSYAQEIVVNDICHFSEGLEEREIDLTEDIREDIVVNLPVKCLCSEGCSGLCPQCGQNLNDGNCDCSDQNDAPSVWDQLDGLDI